MRDAAQAVSRSGWRDSWLSREVFGAIPVVRVLCMPPRPAAAFACGADLMMVAGMLIGMDLGADEVRFLMGWHAGPGMLVAHDDEFARLVRPIVAMTMVLGMGVGMICWNALTALPDFVGGRHEFAQAGSWRQAIFVRHGLAMVPVLRAACLPSLREAGLALGADALAIAGMLAGMAVVDHLMTHSSGPVHGWLMALVRRSA